jgi:hypothetical protein
LLSSSPLCPPGEQIIDVREVRAALAVEEDEALRIAAGHSPLGVTLSWDWQESR